MSGLARSNSTPAKAAINGALTGARREAHRHEEEARAIGKVIGAYAHA
jgi:hypothetical protein